MLKWILSRGIGRSLVQARPGLWERRRDFRLACQWKATVSEGEEAVEARVVDLGPRGARLVADAALKPGTPVRISCRPGGMLLGSQRLPFRITWCRAADSGHELGAALDQESLAQTWVEHALKLLGGLRRYMQPRRYFRAPLMAEVGLADLRGDSLGPAQLRDVSMQGALVTGPAEVEVADSVRFRIGPFRKLPLLQVAARVLSIRSDANSGERLIHLRFYGLDEAQSRLVERYVTLAIEQMERRTTA